MLVISDEASLKSHASLPTAFSPSAKGSQLLELRSAFLPVLPKFEVVLLEPFKELVVVASSLKSCPFIFKECFNES